jgi:hypothetical protein
MIGVMSGRNQPKTLNVQGWCLLKLGECENDLATSLYLFNPSSAWSLFPQIYLRPPSSYSVSHSFISLKLASLTPQVSAISR